MEKRRSEGRNPLMRPVLDKATLCQLHLSLGLSNYATLFHYKQTISATFTPLQMETMDEFNINKCSLVRNILRDLGLDVPDTGVPRHEIKRGEPPLKLDIKRGSSLGMVKCWERFWPITGSVEPRASRDRTVFLSSMKQMCSQRKQCRRGTWEWTSEPTRTRRVNKWKTETEL